MKQRAQSLGLLRIALLYSLFLFAPVLAIISAQPGENIWHICAGIATAVDQLSTEGICDLSGTYTVLNQLGLCNAIPLTLSANGTTISTSGVYCLTNNPTLGALNTVCINANDIVLDLNGHTITGGGSGTGGSTILVGDTTTTVINSAIIRNGFIANSTGNAIATNNNTGGGYNGLIIENITINGTFASPTPTGIQLQGIAVAATVRNVTAYNCTTGINVTRASDSIIENCIMSSCGSGFVTTTPAKNITIKNCISNDNSAYGFSIGGTENIYLESCSASSNAADGFNTTIPAILNNCVSSINTAHGFNGSSGNLIISNSTALNNATGFAGSGTMENCYAFANSALGFAVQGGQFTNCQAVSNAGPGFEISASANLSQCIASSNSNDGFSLLSTVAVGSQFTNCQAVSNTMSGFAINASATLLQCTSSLNSNDGFILSNVSNCSIKNCVASQNTQNGFNCSAVTTGLFNTIEGCSATSNSNGTATFYGFNSADAVQTNVNYYLNTASKNGTSPSTQNYSFSPPGGSSAQVSLVTNNSSRFYGDNLSAV